MTAFSICAYNLALVAGTAWLVWNGWSPWWFLLTLCFVMSYKSGRGSD